MGYEKKPRTSKEIEESAHKLSEYSQELLDSEFLSQKAKDGLLDFIEAIKKVSLWRDIDATKDQMMERTAEFFTNAKPFIELCLFITYHHEFFKQNKKGALELIEEVKNKYNLDVFNISEANDIN
jgi:hypothetical protein